MKIKNIKIGSKLEFLGQEIVVEGIDNLEGRSEMYWIKPKGMIPSKIIHFRGVKLTREKLESYDFERRGDGNFYYEDYIKLSLEDDDWDDAAFDVFIRGTYITCIEFEHQLQNLLDVLE